MMGGPWQASILTRDRPGEVFNKPVTHAQARAAVGAIGGTLEPTDPGEDWLIYVSNTLHRAIQEFGAADITIELGETAYQISIEMP